MSPSDDTAIDAHGCMQRAMHCFDACARFCACAQECRYRWLEQEGRLARPAVPRVSRGLAPAMRSGSGATHLRAIGMATEAAGIDPGGIGGGIGGCICCGSGVDAGGGSAACVLGHNGEGTHGQGGASHPQDHWRTIRPQEGPRYIRGEGMQ
eukprot:364073-Chlamydomonas_euryale.AAC.1